jgi:hypothetical protein
MKDLSRLEYFMGQALAGLCANQLLNGRSDEQIAEAVFSLALEADEKAERYAQETQTEAYRSLEDASVPVAIHPPVTSDDHVLMF